MELLSRIRSEQRDIPIIVMTAFGDIDLAVRAMRGGAQSFVQKPWDNSSLLQILEREVAAGRQAREKTELHARERNDALLIQRALMPAALPEILSGTRIALALSWLLLVSAEMMISRNGLGFLISYSGETGDYAAMFAAVIGVVAIGFLSDRVFLWLMRRLLRWREVPG